MNRIPFVLRSRGVRNSIERSAAILTRFGFTESRFLDQVKGLCRQVSEFGSRPSLPISTVLLERYPHLANELKALPLDLLSHGHTHIDYAMASEEDQRRLIARSQELLERASSPAIGFRAPYLHWESPLMVLLADMRFQFDSSSVYWWPVEEHLALTSAERIAYDRARTFYQPYLAPAEVGPFPRFIGNGLLQIPVSLPDDEILIDRVFSGDPGRVSRVWKAILDQSYAAEGVFVLQLHPERATLLRQALRDVLEESQHQSPPVWLATLNEINEWWRGPRAVVDWSRSEDQIIVRSQDTVRHTVLIQSHQDIPGTLPWVGRCRRILSREVCVAGPRVPAIALGAGCEHLIPALERRGYVYRHTEEGERFSLALSGAMSAEEGLKAAEQCPFPLLRIGHWPAGYRSALVVSGDIDCVTAQDFLWRMME